MIAEYFYKADTTIEIMEGRNFNTFAKIKDSEVIVFGTLTDLIDYEVHGKQVDRIYVGEHELINVQAKADKGGTFKELVKYYEEGGVTAYAFVREFIYGTDWSEFDDKENQITYSTKEKADESLQGYISDVNNAHEAGDLSDPYGEDCRIVEVQVYNDRIECSEIEMPFILKMEEKASLTTVEGIKEAALIEIKKMRADDSYTNDDRANEITLAVEALAPYDWEEHDHDYLIKCSPPEILEHYIDSILPSVELFLKAKVELLDDVNKELIPRALADFTELHEYVDANEYGGLTEDTYTPSVDYVIENRFQGILDSWIKSGALKQ